MSSRILKYRLSGDEDQPTITTHKGSTIRAVGIQSREIHLWIEVPSDTPLVTRAFRIVGTGANLPDEGNYVGIVFDGSFVWHIIEVPL